LRFCIFSKLMKSILKLSRIFNGDGHCALLKTGVKILGTEWEEGDQRSIFFKNQQSIIFQCFPMLQSCFSAQLGTLISLSFLSSFFRLNRPDLTCKKRILEFEIAIISKGEWVLAARNTVWNFLFLFKILLTSNSLR
jgi:hypothetical protein